MFQKLFQTKLNFLGTPTPPTPPQSKLQIKNNLRPATLNISKTDNTTDFDLLGSPGDSPPTPPPIAFY